jgi:hypothetical protein
MFDTWFAMVLDMLPGRILQSCFAVCLLLYKAMVCCNMVSVRVVIRTCIHLIAATSPCDVQISNASGEYMACSAQ